MVRLRALGGLSVEGGEGPPGGAASQRKALALLGLVAGAGARGLSRDKIVAYLWPESPADKAAHRLTQLLYTLRRDLRTEDLFLGSTELRLNPGVIATDVAEFTGALEAGDFVGAARAYGGPFLDGFFLSDAVDFERWVDGERARLAQRYAAAMELLAVEAARRGQLDVAAGWWRQLSQADPLNARVAAKYIEALGAVGDRAGALRFGRIYEALLRAEFDADPDPQVLAALERLKSGPAVSAVPTPTAPAVAVLPFVNLTSDQDNDYFSDGMTDELTNALARVPGLRVASRISAFAFKGRDMDVRQIAEQLAVSMLVAGSVRKVGDRIRLTVQLVSGTDGCHLWSETYDRTLEDVFTLQEELSQAVVRALPLSGAASSTPLVRQPTPVLDAYTFYLRGRYSAYKRTPDALALATEYFEQAVEKDANFALAHASLAECWALRGFPEFGDLPARDAMPRAKAAALDALRLDPRLSPAHTWLGVVHFVFDWDWAAAEGAFRRALQLQPGNAYAETWYAIFLGAIGRHEDSIRHSLYAEALEPAAPQIRLCVPRCYYFARRYEMALECLEDIRRAEPGGLLPTIWTARTLCALGRYADALSETERVPPPQRTVHSDVRRGRCARWPRAPRSGPDGLRRGPGAVGSGAGAPGIIRAPCAGLRGPRQCRRCLGCPREGAARALGFPAVRVDRARLRSAARRSSIRRAIGRASAPGVKRQLPRGTDHRIQGIELRSSESSGTMSNTVCD